MGMLQKRITFENMTYDVPLWVNFIARERCGNVYGFEREPYVVNILSTGWSTTHRYHRLQPVYDAHWKSSITTLA